MIYELKVGDVVKWDGDQISQRTRDNRYKIVSDNGNLFNVVSLSDSAECSFRKERLQAA